MLLIFTFGFGKNLSHNYSLLVRPAEFHHFNLPLLVGMPMKSMIGELLNAGPSERLSGSRARSLPQCKERTSFVFMTSKKP
ncbi:dihydropteroate synthase [Shigella flexneri]